MNLEHSFCDQDVSVQIPTLSLYPGDAGQGIEPVFPSTCIHRLEGLTGDTLEGWDGDKTV